MSDPATLSFALTYAGTLAVAALMFIGQLAAFAILLTIAVIAWILTLPVHTLIRRADK
jgi:hypothetical protein